MTKRKKIILISISTICILIWIGVGLFSLAFLEPIIQSLARDGAVMVADTQQLWGEVPGKTGTVVVRNFTFYNFTNPMQFLFQNQKPTFTQLGGYILQQKSSFLNYNFTDGQSKVQYDYWTYFGDINSSKSLNDSVYIINPAPLGFWSQLNNVNKSIFMLQGLGQLFLELNSTFKTQVIGQGIASQFLPTFKEMFEICQKINIGIDKCHILWEDPNNGLLDNNNYEVWVNAGYYKDEDSINYLHEYFIIEELGQLLNYFDEWGNTLASITDNWYNDGIQTTNYDLVAKQMSSCAITNNPPAGASPIETFCSQNQTCEGYPQIESFKNNILGEKYKNVYFTEDTFKYLLDRKGLLHIGHLNWLFYWGEHYDYEQAHKNDIGASYYLHKIQQRFNLESQLHAQVFWKWSKYIANEFVLKESKGGSGKIAGLAGVFAVSLYQSFIEFHDWIIPQLRSLIANQSIQNCSYTISKQYPDLSSKVINQICFDVTNKQYKSYYKLFKPCISKNYNNKQIQFTPLQYAIYCDQSNYIVSLLKQIDNSIALHYACQFQYQCTPFELTIKQFVNSTITLNPIPQDHRRPSLTANTWINNFTKFQYQYFAKEIKKVQSIITIKLQYLKDLFSFDKLWSVPMIQNLLLGSQEYFQKTFYLGDRDMFIQYMRYVVIEIGFGGFIQKRNVTQLLNGYEDQFLKTLQQTDPLLGGDPSINYVVAFNGLNSTKQHPITLPMIMYTGKSDSKLTRQYVSVYNNQYIVYNRSYFDGDNICWNLQNPYLDKVQIKGTDGFSAQPSFTKDDQFTVYLSDLTRYGTTNYKGQKELFGFTVYQMRINKQLFYSEEQYQPNHKFFQKFNGFVNLSFQGFPLFVSRNHFYGAPTNWSELIDVYDQHRNKMESNIWDDTIIYLQPYTGIAFSATIFLQSNYFYSQDILFNNTDRMIPIFSLFRSGNISAEQVDSLLGDLKFIIKAKRNVFLVAIILIILIVVIFVGCFLHQRRIKNKQNEVEYVEKKQSLMQSLQKNDPQ